MFKYLQNKDLNTNLYGLQDQKRMKVDQYVTRLIIGKSLPLTLVDSTEFKELVNCLDKRYAPPGSLRLRNKLIPASVERIKSNLKRILKNIIKLNISSDIWSDPDLRAFIAFGAHGIDDEWKLIKCVIGVRRIIGSHTNELIQKEFIELAKEYGIENNVYKFITDGGSNFVKAFNEDNLTKYCNLFDELVQDIEIEDEIEEKQAENSESSIDPSINENNFQNEVIIKKLLEDQKLARQSAKILSNNNKNNQESIYVNPLLFWKEKQHIYFHLSKVARAYFGIPVTSAFVERFFSKIGYILRPHRRCMLDDLAENLFYCKENMNFLHV